MEVNDLQQSSKAHQKKKRTHGRDSIRLY